MTHNAKRYQFLRDRFALESSNDEAEFAKLAHLNGDEFDAALDAAMAKSGFEIAQEVEPVACLIPVLSQAADCKVNGKFYQFHYGAHHKAEILFFAAPQAVNASMFQALQDIASGTYDTWTEGYRAQQIAVAALQKAERAKP